MEAGHCLEIGEYASQKNHHAQAVEWLELAREKAVEDLSLNVTSIDLALDAAIEKVRSAFKITETAICHVSAFVSQHDAAHVESDVRRHLSFDQKLAPIRNFENYTSICRRNRAVAVEKFRGNKNDTYLRENYWGLCTDDIYGVIHSINKP